MPSSLLEIAPAVINMVYRRPHGRVLDVGAGHGKYGVLLREYASVEQVDAVEAWEPYVRDHRLTGIYDFVWAVDVCVLPASRFGRYDGVLMVDVIEHIDKAEALDLLARIPGWVVVCTPAVFFQNPEATTIPPEEHRSVWGVEDFGDRVDEVHDNPYGAVLVALAPLR